MNEMATGVRTKRRMSGIPPLAPDLVIDGPVATVRAEHPAPAVSAPAAPAVQQDIAPAVTAPTASSSGVLANRRRLAGASTVPLLVAQAVAATLNEQVASQQVSPVQDAAGAQPDSVPEIAPVAVPSTPVTTAPKGRRMPGASNVPLLVAPSQPAMATAQAPAELPSADQEPAAMPVSVHLSDLARPAAPDNETAEIQASVAQPVATQAAAPAAPATKAPAKKASSKYTKLAWQLGAVLLFAVVAVLVAQWARGTEVVQGFIETYSGHASQPVSTPEGIPAWLGWQHFLNSFFMVLIVRSGLQVRLQSKPPGYWTAKKRSFFSPGSQSPKKISLTQWFHQLLDVAWVLNGVLFVIALFVSGFWARIVPTSWDVFPNMLSAGIQYASLDWPDENGWIHYNALQVMAYFITVFIAAPLAIISGMRMSTWWPSGNGKLSKIYPVEVARAIHIPVMVYFVGFVAVHVFLVFFTGARRNLNHMFTSRDVVDFWGLVIFAVSVLVTVAAWFLTSPMFIRPLAAAMGKLSKN